jgi:deferrochelatase/peroxidase EfeB
MDQGPVTAPRTPGKAPSWRLKPPHDVATQGFVVSAFADLPVAEALFLCFDWPENGPGEKPIGKGQWLQNLGKVAPITDADGKESRAATLAFTFSGLQKVGLSSGVLATFSQPFREGMYQEDRLRRLGDRIRTEWQPTVIPGGPLWSGNVAELRQAAAPAPAHAAWDRPVGEIGSPKEDEELEAHTALTVHALLLLYGHDEDETKNWADAVEQVLLADQVKVVRRLWLHFNPENGIAREHFGFADGTSQPMPYEATVDGEPAGVLVTSDGNPVARDDCHGVPLGEILMGHINAHHERAPGPYVPYDKDPKEAKWRDIGLTPDGAPEGYLNFGLNGSYLVVRELRQYVERFWDSMKQIADRINKDQPGAAPVNAEWVAERVIGRNVNGDLLCPASVSASGYLKPDAYGDPQNQFRFRKDDPDGFGCPLGSHVRRANPRDGLAKDMGSADTLLDAANNHRILRRGRKFGTSLARDQKDDGTDRGLLFMCLNTDIARQFEFVQHVWLLNTNFATLFDETDPLIGPKGGFTIPEQPLRRIVNVETFIQMAGGDYFFLPSMPALKYIAALSVDFPKEAATP